MALVQALPKLETNSHVTFKFSVIYFMIVKIYNLFGKIFVHEVTNRHFLTECLFCYLSRPFSTFKASLAPHPLALLYLHHIQSQERNNAQFFPLLSKPRDGIGLFEGSTIQNP